MPIQPETTAPFTCAQCGTPQRVYVGDLTDETAPDTHAVKCFVCGTVEFVLDEITREGLGGEENWYVETGIPLK